MVSSRFMADLHNLSRPISNSKLVHLSDLSLEEAKLFQAEWPSIDVMRRRQIVSRLVELAEDNLDLDFDKVFHVCLGDADSEVKARAIEGLWACEERFMVDKLIGLLLGDGSSVVRASAAAALRKFALLVELGKLPAKDGVRIEKALSTAF